MISFSFFFPFVFSFISVHNSVTDIESEVHWIVHVFFFSVCRGEKNVIIPNLGVFLLFHRYLFTLKVKYDQWRNIYRLFINKKEIMKKKIEEVLSIWKSDKKPVTQLTGEMNEKELTDRHTYWFNNGRIKDSVMTLQNGKSPILICHFCRHVTRVFIGFWLTELYFPIFPNDYLHLRNEVQSSYVSFKWSSNLFIFF